MRKAEISHGCVPTSREKESLGYIREEECTRRGKGSRSYCVKEVLRSRRQRRLSGEDEGEIPLSAGAAPSPRSVVHGGGVFPRVARWKKNRGAPQLEKKCVFARKNLAG
ncbi:hypothetical protein MTO96_032142 [Rhipicephalus appendiculatus]